MYKMYFYGSELLLSPLKLIVVKHFIAIVFIIKMLGHVENSQVRCTRETSDIKVCS